ncbi:hypothetical protein [Nocardiopsis synnemataformans]|uniref:phage terminase small subunit n=1 Tax=Nocardiopsis synnemataformans TaxID=61305 RepID=UPI003EBFD9C5
MGTRGPVPKHSSERRRRNKPADGETTTVAKVPRSRKVTVPAADKDWHPIAKRWYTSLKTSGQSEFYEPSDWAAAYLIAESISRDLKPQVVGITEQGDVVKDEIPLKGASLAAYLKAMSVLLVTEGDRRRMRLELQAAEEEGPSAAVTALNDYRDALGG